MAILLFSLLDGCDQSFGNAAEGNSVNRWLDGKYSIYGIGQHAGIVGGKDARHLVGGWRVRRGAMGGFIRHVGVRHGGGSVEDIENDAADVQAGPISGTCRDIPCRRRGV